MTALRARKKSFLTEPDWKKLPWRGVQKSPKDLLLDVLVDVPTIFEAMDIMSRCEDSKLKANYKERLYKEYVLLERRLRLWHKRFSPVLDIFEKSFIIQDGVKPQSLAAAHVLTLYWATCVIIYGLVGKVLMAQGCEEELFEGKYVDPGTFCQDILKIIPLFLHCSTGIFRVHLATPPISVSMIYLYSLPPEEMKEEKALLLRYLQDPSCATMRKFLGSMNPQESTKIHRN